MCPRNLAASAPENKDVLNVRAGLECRVDNGLGRNGLPTAAPFVGGKDDVALAVIDAVTKSLGGKASEYDRVDSTDARASEEGSDGLPCHGKVDGDGVALFDTEGFEYIGDAGNFMQQFSIGDLASFAWLVSLVDDRGL